MLDSFSMLLINFFFLINEFWCFFLFFILISINFSQLSWSGGYTGIFFNCKKTLSDYLTVATMELHLLDSLGVNSSQSSPGMQYLRPLHYMTSINIYPAVWITVSIFSLSSVQRALYRDCKCRFTFQEEESNKTLSGFHRCSFII